MSDTCPANTVDEHAARTVAAIVLLLAALSLWSPAGWVVASLEAGLGFCLACWIYSVVFRARAAA
ncbi:MAG TPA: hypothetical protein VIK83_03355 [Coriobacteriia bacterium]